MNDVSLILILVILFACIGFASIIVFVGHNRESRRRALKKIPQLIEKLEPNVGRDDALEICKEISDLMVMNGINEKDVGKSMSWIKTQSMMSYKGYINIAKELHSEIVGRLGPKHPDTVQSEKDIKEMEGKLSEFIRKENTPWHSFGPNPEIANA